MPLSPAQRYQAAVKRLQPRQAIVLFQRRNKYHGQGNPVPVLYGRLRVGSQVISAGLDTVQI